MKLTEYLKEDQTIFSFEILPPLKGNSIESIYRAIDPLMEFKPALIDGSFDRVSITKRPGTVAICAAIQGKYQVEAVPHLICGGFNRQDTENALIDLHFLGIDSVLALRGDNQKGERYFEPEEDGNSNSLDLIHQIKNMNTGIYLDDEVKNAKPTNFCVGAAGYPEKHVDAPNIQNDLNFLKRKVEAGAEFITTQMFFDNKKYFEYVKNCRDMGVNVPIIPGIKPITSKKQVHALARIFNIEIPIELTSEIEKAKTDEAVEQIGIEWCINQCKELKSFGVPVLHFYTMGFPRITSTIASEVF
jgi:methylenetetrahydrofolate reductase (NADPH)